MPNDTEADPELEQFAYRFFETNGAALEKKPNGFEALLTEKLCRHLDVPEFINIGNPVNAFSIGEIDKQPEDMPKATIAMDFGSPLLEKMVHMACGNVPFISCELEFDYLKSQGFGHLFDELFVFHKAVGKVTRTAIVKTEYIYLTCSYLAQSDEQKEGLVRMIFHTDTGAYVPGMAGLISQTARTYHSESMAFSTSDEQSKSIINCLDKYVNELVESEIEMFRLSMNRRFKRDRKSLKEYYDGLKDEMEKSLKRPGLSKDLIKERQEKIGLLPNELKAKEEDLFKKYSIKVKFAPCTILQVKTPAVKVFLKVSVGRKTRELSFVYNPVIKALDPLVCESCGESIYQVFFCDNLHVLCRGCNGACSAC
jgi:hypothetical protein